MIQILFHPLFLALLGTLLTVLKLTGTIHLTWWLVLLPFYIRPAIVLVINLILTANWLAEAKKWRSKLKVEDRAYRKNNLGNWVIVRVKGFEDNGQTVLYTNPTRPTANPEKTDIQLLFHDKHPLEKSDIEKAFDSLRL